MRVLTKQSGQWPIETANKHRLGSVARLKATDARNLPMPVKVALRMKDKVAKSPDELLKWTGDLNRGLHTEHWKVLDTLTELKGPRHILLTDWDSYKSSWRPATTFYRTHSGGCQGTE
jgi:hypothetical protein